MAADTALVKATLDSLGKLILNERTINLFEGHESNIAKFIDEYLADHPGTEFVGTGAQAQRRTQIGLDLPHHSFWKDSATVDWEITPTGLNTFDELFSETASQGIRLDAQPDHWCYLAGFVEVGSANSLVRLRYTSINGDARSRISTVLINRLGAIKYLANNPAFALKTRGFITIDGEFDGAAPVEVIPVALHLMPQEILDAASFAAYVTDTA